MKEGSRSNGGGEQVPIKPKHTLLVTMTTFQFDKDKNENTEKQTNIIAQSLSS